MDIDWKKNIEDYRELNRAESAIFREMGVPDGRFSFDTEQLAYVYRDLMNKFSVIACRSERHPYLFILLLTKFEESVGRDVELSALEILDNYVYAQENAIESDVTISIANVALYYIALVAYRYGDKERLRFLLKKYGPYFEHSGAHKPYLYELYSRFCGMNHDYMRQMLFSVSGQQAVEEIGIDEKNVALNVAYSNAVVNMAEICFYDKQFFLRKKQTSLKEEKENAPVISFEILDAAPMVYHYTRSDLDGLLDSAIEKIKEAIYYNPDYPKYYFLMAKLSFYSALYGKGMLNETERNNIFSYIECAEEKVKSSNKNAMAILEQYRRFENMIAGYPLNVKGWTEMKGFTREALKSRISRAIDPKSVRPYSFEPGSKAPHVFISYSSRDFKQVYCDIVELTKGGILCDYDNEMDRLDNTIDNSDSQKWYNVIEEKIRNASCVICFLSKDYMVSPAVLKELSFIEKYEKEVIVVDLSGYRCASSIFVQLARDKNYANFVNSELLFQHVRIFKDDITAISRNKDCMDTLHIKQLRNRIFSICPEIRVSLHSEAKTLIGRKKGHPMEDVIVNDNESGLFMVVDGITRLDRSEYVNDNSPVAEIADAFCKSFQEKYAKELLTVRDDMSEESLLKNCFEHANGAIRETVSQYTEKVGNKGAFFEPLGCVGAIAAVYRDYLYFASVGDCMGILVRKNQKTIFADKQTAFAFRKKDIEKDRKMLYEEYVNHPENLFGYGVINGDKRASKFFNVSRLKLEFEDSIYLVSDGISDFIQFGNPKEYDGLSLDEIIERAISSEEALKGQGCPYDDIAIIRIRWSCNGMTVDKND